MERKPALKSIADPANLESGVPAMEAAAKIKQAEDMKAQKIKAIKYLATIGCGCYDKDKTITNAMLASLEDCTEEVRLATVQAIMTAAEGKACGNCHSNCCCGKELVEKLSDIAYERDDSGCYLEPSERVRAAAQQALSVCCPSRQPLEIVEALPEDEGFSDEDMQEAPEDQVPSNGTLPLNPGISAPVVPSVPSASDAVRHNAPQNFREEHQARAMPQSSRRSFRADLAVNKPSSTSKTETVRAPSQWVAEQKAEIRDVNRQPMTPSSSRRVARTRPVSFSAPSEAGSAAVVSAIRGNVAGIDGQRGLVVVQVRDNRSLPIGSQLKVYLGQASVEGESLRMEVVESQPGLIRARMLEVGRLGRIARGDEVIGW
jgi:hypothetical protein